MRELRATDISAGYWTAIVVTDMPDESVPMWREPNCHPTTEDDEEGHDSLVVVHRVAQRTWMTLCISLNLSMLLWLTRP